MITMTPEEFKAQVRASRTVREVQRLITITWPCISGTVHENWECLRLADAKLMEFGSDGDGALGGPGSVAMEVAA